VGTSRGHKGTALSDQPMTQPDAWRMIRRRARSGRYCRSNRLPYFPRHRNCLPVQRRNGGALEHAQEMAAHESPRTTKLYDRTKERLTQDEVERIRL